MTCCSDTLLIGSLHDRTAAADTGATSTRDGWRFGKAPRDEYKLFTTRRKPRARKFNLRRYWPAPQATSVAESMRDVRYPAM